MNHAQFQFVRPLLATLLLILAAHCGLQARADQPSPAAATATVRIVLAGDSTVAKESGWGPGFAHHLRPGVDFINLARGGRSSKSFRDEGWWKKVIDSKPTYVLIQFGHNDVKGKGPKRETDPATTFPENIGRYVDEARAAGATPVLVTSIPRRHFDSEGKIKSDLIAYVDAVKKVAEEKKVALIDLHALNIQLLNQLGPKGSSDWNPTVERKQDGKTVEGPDTTHLTPKASEIVGGMVAESLVKVVPELAEWIR